MTDWPLITDHVWRGSGHTSDLEAPCAYWGCRSGRSEHGNARLPKGLRADTRAARRKRGEPDK